LTPREQFTAKGLMQPQIVLRATIGVQSNKKVRAVAARQPS